MANNNNEFDKMAGDDYDPMSFGAPEADVKGRTVAGASKKVFLKTATGVGKGLWKGTKGEIGRQFPQTAAITDEAISTIDEFRELGRDIGKEVGPTVNSLKQLTLKAMPFAKKLVPKKMYESIEQRLKNSITPEEKEKDVEEERSTAIANSLNEVFKAQMDVEQQNRETDMAEKQVNKQLEKTRFKEIHGALASIDQRLLLSNTFYTTSATAYMKKSLELKYQHLYVAKDSYSVLKGLAGVLEARLEEIKHNTGLPEHSKIKFGERVVGSVKSQMSEDLSSYISGMREKVMENVREAIMSPLKQFTSQASFGLGMASMAADMAISMKGEDDVGITKSDLAGHAGGFLGQGLGWLLGTKHTRNLATKMAPFVNDFEGASRDFKTRASLGVRDWADKRRGTGGITGKIADLVPQYRASTFVDNTMLTASQEAVPFDNTVRQSIVEVMPRHLERIGMYIEGVAKTLAPNAKFDYQTYNVHRRKLTSTEQFVKDTMTRELGTEEDRARQMILTTASFEAAFASQSEQYGADAKVSEFAQDKKYIQKFITNSGLYQQTLDPEAIRNYAAMGSTTNREASGYINKVLNGIPENKKRAVATYLTIMLFRKDNTIENVIVRKLGNKIIEEISRVGRLQRGLPLYMETFGQGAALERYYDREKGINTENAQELFNPSISGPDAAKHAEYRTSAIDWEKRELEEAYANQEALVKEFGGDAYGGYGSFKNKLVSMDIPGISTVAKWIPDKANKIISDVLKLKGWGEDPGGLTTPEALDANGNPISSATGLPPAWPAPKKNQLLLMAPPASTPESEDKKGILNTLVDMSTDPEKFQETMRALGIVRPERNVNESDVAYYSRMASLVWEINRSKGLPKLKALKDKVDNSFLGKIANKYFNKGKKAATAITTNIIEGLPTEEELMELTPASLHGTVKAIINTSSSSAEILSKLGKHVKDPETYKTLSAQVVAGYENIKDPVERKKMMTEAGAYTKSVYNDLKTKEGRASISSKISGAWSDATKKLAKAFNKDYVESSSSGKLFIVSPDGSVEAVERTEDNSPRPQGRMGKAWGKIKAFTTNKYNQVVGSKNATAASSFNQEDFLQNAGQQLLQEIVARSGGGVTKPGAGTGSTLLGPDGRPIFPTVASTQTTPEAALINPETALINPDTEIAAADIKDPEEPGNWISKKWGNSRLGKIWKKKHERDKAAFAKSRTDVKNATVETAISVKDIVKDTWNKAREDLAKLKEEREEKKALVKASKASAGILRGSLFGDDASPPQDRFHADFRTFASAQIAANNAIIEVMGMGGLNPWGHHPILGKIIGGAKSLVGGAKEILKGGLSVQGHAIKGMYHGGGALVGGLGRGLGAAIGGVAPGLGTAIGGLGGGLWSGLGSATGGLWKGTGHALKGIGYLGGGLLKGAGYMLNPLGLAMPAMKNAFRRMTRKKFFDVYLKDQIVPGAPLISAKKQEDGVYFADGKKLKNTMQITAPIFEAPVPETDGDLPKCLVTMDDIKHGLVDSQNRTVRSRFSDDPGDSLRSVVSGVASLFKGGAWLTGGIAGMWGKLLSGGTGLAVGGFKGLAKMIGRMFGLDLGATKEYQDRMVLLVSRIVEIMKSNAVAHDSDGDGIRDGSVADQDKNKDGSDSGKEGTGTKSKRSNGTQSLLSALGMGSGKPGTPGAKTDKDGVSLAELAVGGWSANRIYNWFKKPIVKVWNKVGKPVWNKVGKPVWNKAGKPVWDLGVRTGQKISASPAGRKVAELGRKLLPKGGKFGSKLLPKVGAKGLKLVKPLTKFIPYAGAAIHGAELAYGMNSVKNMTPEQRAVLREELKAGTFGGGRAFTSGQGPVREIGKNYRDHDAWGGTKRTTKQLINDLFFLLDGVAQGQTAMVGVKESVGHKKNTLTEVGNVAMSSRIEEINRNGLLPDKLKSLLINAITRAYSEFGCPKQVPGKVIEKLVLLYIKCGSKKALLGLLNDAKNKNALGFGRRDFAHDAVFGSRVSEFEANLDAVLLELKEEVSVESANEQETNKSSTQDTTIVGDASLKSKRKPKWDNFPTATDGRNIPGSSKLLHKTIINPIRKITAEEVLEQKQPLGPRIKSAAEQTTAAEVSQLAQATGDSNVKLLEQIGLIARLLGGIATATESAPELQKTLFGELNKSIVSANESNAGALSEVGKVGLLAIQRAMMPQTLTGAPSPAAAAIGVTKLV